MQQNSVKFSIAWSTIHFVMLFSLSVSNNNNHNNNNEAHEISENDMWDINRTWHVRHQPHMAYGTSASHDMIVGHQPHIPCGTSTSYSIWDIYLT